MRYVVGYTDTDEGRDALALAVRLARTTGARLDLVLVLESAERATLVPADPGYERYLRETTEGWLATGLAHVPAGIEATTHVVYAESPADGLLEAVETLRAELIVIGTSPTGLLGRFTLGSDANALLHSAPVPVALAPGGCAAAGGAPISRVTCAIGTRPGADELLAAAIGATRRGDVPLRLVSLVALDQPGGAPASATGTAHPDAATRAEAHAAAVLEEAVAHLPATITVTSQVATGRRIEDAVAALDWWPDEIALVGSSRLAQPKRLFLGSTAAKMLRELPVPLMVVPRDAEFTLGDL
ncbi:universal stress protein [Herbiconiux moechotypicola]|uniref:Universal stress protein n=1 Tax=Herbiconiux moechotypicola TaxID=637393 RepID=A0ABN3DSJ1_9MICO|nr:universal stress protein [Herbiconiux moechotypicola]MCS5730705.1 universal stress protein [Herbiconiux moechotypicola]